MPSGWNSRAVKINRKYIYICDEIPKFEKHNFIDNAAASGAWWEDL